MPHDPLLSWQPSGTDQLVKVRSIFLDFFVKSLCSFFLLKQDPSFQRPPKQRGKGSRLTIKSDWSGNLVASLSLLLLQFPFSPQLINWTNHSTRIFTWLFSWLNVTKIALVILFWRPSLNLALTVDRSCLLVRPSKGFERQATLRQNVATICYQSTDSRQKLTWNGRQFAKTTIHFSFRQSDHCTFFLRRRHDCHDLTRPAWLFWSSIVCVYGRSVVQILTKTNHHSTLFTKS